MTSRAQRRSIAQMKAARSNPIQSPAKRTANETMSLSITHGKFRNCASRCNYKSMEVWSPHDRVHGLQPQMSCSKRSFAFVSDCSTTTRRLAAGALFARQWCRAPVKGIVPARRAVLAHQVTRSAILALQRCDLSLCGDRAAWRSPINRDDSSLCNFDGRHLNGGRSARSARLACASRGLARLRMAAVKPKRLRERRNATSGAPRRRSSGQSHVRRPVPSRSVSSAFIGDAVRACLCRIETGQLIFESNASGLRGRLLADQCLNPCLSGRGSSSAAVSCR